MYIITSENPDCNRKKRKHQQNKGSNQQNPSLVSCTDVDSLIDLLLFSCYNGLADFGDNDTIQKLQSKDKNATHAFSACQSR